MMSLAVVVEVAVVAWVVADLEAAPVVVGAELAAVRAILAVVA